MFDLRLLLQIYMMRRSRRHAARWTFRKLGASEGERGRWERLEFPGEQSKSYERQTKSGRMRGGGTGAAGWVASLRVEREKRMEEKVNTFLLPLSLPAGALSLLSKPLRDVQFNFGESWKEGRWEGDSAHVESFLSIRCWCDVGVIPLFSVPHGQPTSSAPPIDSNLQHSLR